ncbi:dienelactone hydrolase family protein [Endobacter medicaginis]|nr:dienelactone hydrolase family protein [Endobacter medicaginis]
MAETMSDLRGTDIPYSDGRLDCLGYQAEASADAPWVVVVHEWSGLNHGTKAACDRLAGLGFNAFALDVFGAGTRGDETGDNSHLIGPLLGDRTELLRRLTGGFEAVKRLPGVPEGGLGAMGFCFGGLSVLDMARAALPGLRAVISIHGILAAPPTPTGPIAASVLALHGWEDPFADTDAVKAFAEEMTTAGADWQLHAYGHAKHAFSFPRANKPEMGILYEPRAAARTWRTIPAFFDETLRGG